MNAGSYHVYIIFRSDRRKTAPPAVHLAYHKKEGYYFFQELHVKLVEVVGFETPAHHISHTQL
jgi:hypothetical protein